VPGSLTDLGQIRRQTVGPPSTFTYQITSESVYCVTLQGQKIAIFGKF